MNPIKRCVDDLRFALVKNARSMPSVTKLEGGGRLFGEMCERMATGIRADFPCITNAEALAELRRRIDLNSRLEGSL